MNLRKFIDELSEKVEDKFEESVCSIYDKVEEKADALREKAGELVSDRLRSGELHPGTVKIATGAAKVSYGLARGAIAAGGVLGHGVAGVLTRQRNPGLIKVGGELIKSGFEDAGHSIQEGARIFKEGLEEHQK